MDRQIVMQEPSSPPPPTNQETWDFIDELTDWASGKDKLNSFHAMAIVLRAMYELRQQQFH